MRSIIEIIDTLADEGRSLAAGLLKARSLLRASGQTEMVSWVDRELIGYFGAHNVPTYRRLRADILADVQDPGGAMASCAIAMTHPPENHRESQPGLCLTGAVTVLEDFVRGSEQWVRVPGALQLYPSLHNCVSAEARIQTAWLQCERRDVMNVLASVRSRLRRFMFALKEHLGAIEEAELTAKVAATDMRSLFDDFILAAPEGHASALEEIAVFSGVPHCVYPVRMREVQVSCITEVDLAKKLVLLALRS